MLDRYVVRPGQAGEHSSGSVRKLRPEQWAKCFRLGDLAGSSEPERVREFVHDVRSPRLDVDLYGVWAGPLQWAGGFRWSATDEQPPPGVRQRSCVARRPRDTRCHNTRPRPQTPLDTSAPAPLRPRPNLGKKTAQHHVYAARSEPREDRFQVSYDRIWFCAPQDVIIAALNDRDANAVRHITVEPSRDISEGVPCDASVPDLSLVPCGPQKGFQARGERLVTSHSESCSVAVANSDYSDPLSGRLARE